jgi:hypothetical protein
MSADFVPYLTALKKNGAVSSAGEELPKEASLDGTPFKPLATPPKPTPGTTTPLPQPQTACRASLSITRDGDRVIRIQVKCACGELINLDCSY